MEIDNVEKFFLNTLLKIAIAGISIVFISDATINPEDLLSLSIDGILLVACVLAFFIRNIHQTASVLVVTIIVLLSMFYQSIEAPANTTTSLSIILVVGFVFSVMLKERLMWVMHSLTFLAINSVFIYQVYHPEINPFNKTNDIITISVTYSILYIILAFAAAMLKSSYDKINRNLSQANDELRLRADKIEVQNKELIEVHEELNALNKDLEIIVDERTKKLKERTERLEKYSFSNAHYLRGPIARLLGLISLRKLEKAPDSNFFFQQMEDQVNEIDSVVKQINKDLEESNPVSNPEE